MRPWPPFALLAASMASVILIDAIGPLAPILCWVLAATAFTMLLRRGNRAAAVAGLVTLAVLVTTSLALVGVTVGLQGRPIAKTAQIDPSTVALGLGFAAPWFATALYLAVHEHRRGRRLATLACGILLVAAYAWAWSELSRIGIRLIPSLGFSDAILSFLFWLIAGILAYALVRAARDPTMLPAS